MTFFISTKSNIHKQKYYYKEGKNNKRCSIYLSKITHGYSFLQDRKRLVDTL